MDRQRLTPQPAAGWTWEGGSDCDTSPCSTRIRDLLEGFAARGWSDALDFDTLAPQPASFVGPDLEQRHGDLVWRIRFGAGRWLYLMLLLEFQATVDPAMAVRMLAYTALLYQRLAADGELRGDRALPPVLPVVIYNGRRPWTVPVEMKELVGVESERLAPYQPSQRYYLLDAGRVCRADRSARCRAAGPRRRTSLRETASRPPARARVR